MKILFKYNKVSGIYKITSTKSGNFYIGSSKNLYQRLHKHRCLLKKGCHENLILNQSVAKYGIDSFDCDVIELCNIEDLKSREQYYIDLLKPKYNITRLVERNILSEDSRKKISTTLILKYKNGLSLQNNKPIYVYNLEGEFLKKYNSIRKASFDLKIGEDSIRKVISKKLNRFHEFVFSVEPIVFSKIYKKYILIDYVRKVYKDFDYVKDAAVYIGKIKKNLEVPLKTKKLYLKRYKIVKTGDSIKLDELLEHLEADNQQPSLGSTNKYQEGSTTNV